MPDRIFDLRLFRYALASAEHGSFRRAAAALNVQQSTVSRGVRSLEHSVGAELFERYHAGIRPTPAGDRFLEEVTWGVDHLRLAMRRVGESQRGEQGKLTVAMCVPITLLADVFEKFRKEYSGVSVEMDESTSSEGWALVQRRAIDVAFIAKPLRLGVARSLHLRNERMIAVLPKSHPQAGARRLSLEDLRLERFILCAGGLGPEIERHLARRMGKWGVEPRIQLHRLGQSNLINMVALGFGVTIIVGPAPRTAADGVVAIPLSSSNAVSLCAAWMESNPNPALKKLLEFLGPPSRFGRAKR